MHPVSILLYLEAVVSLRVVVVGVLNASVTAEVTHFFSMAKFFGMGIHIFNRKVQENKHFSIDYLGKPMVVEKQLRVLISSVL